MAQSSVTPANPGIVPPTQADPLAQLRDIHLPPAIDIWPPAPGWWGLAFLGILATLSLLYWLWGRWQANKYRREAIRQLESILEKYASDGDASLYLHDYQLLLKRVALTRFNRDLVASLTGEAWVAFLDKSSNGSEFSMGAGQALVDGNYVDAARTGIGSADIESLHQLGQQWIRKHHALPAGIGSEAA